MSRVLIADADERYIGRVGVAAKSCPVSSTHNELRYMRVSKQFVCETCGWTCNDVPDPDWRKSGKE